VDASLPDADLERLLAQLLRTVSPAVVGGARGSGPAGTARRDGSAVEVPGSGPAVAAVEPAAAGAAATAGATGAADQQDTGSAATSVPAGLPAVSGSEARALIELLAARGIAQGQLAALLGLEKSTVSRLAAGLEHKGWLRRGRDDQNQRYVRLYLTPAGIAVASQLWRAWRSRQARILASLSPEERAGLAAGLRGLVRGLEAEGLLDGTDARP
jgi:DNA-binding MarR family transcriptional regulator